MPVIDADGLSKHYGDTAALTDLSLSVHEGEVFGFLGPNGAGKTTTIRTLMGFQSPTAGTATVLGADVRDERALVDAKQRIGYLPANPAFDETVTGRELLDLHAEVKGDERREELLERFHPPLERPIREYSTGNKQMLGIVQAFMHDPDLVLMDEPTAGLDPLKQESFNEFLAREKARGKTVFFSSHVLSEVRRVCDRVGILRAGELVTIEDVASLLERGGKRVRLRVADDLRPEALQFPGVHDLDVRRPERAAVPAGGPGPVEPGAGGDPGGDGGDAAVESTADHHAGLDAVTDCSFTYTGDYNALVDRLDEHDLLELSVEEAPLEDVFARFYGERDV